jgi:hypothetical protein
MPVHPRPQFSSDSHIQRLNVPRWSGWKFISSIGWYHSTLLSPAKQPCKPSGRPLADHCLDGLMQVRDRRIGCAVHWHLVEAYTIGNHVAVIKGHGWK